MGDITWRNAVGACTALMVAFLAMEKPACAQQGAEAFVQQNTGMAVTILSDRALTPAEKREKLEGLMSTMLDLNRMALFALGPAAKTTAAADLDSFLAAYRQFALASYTSELGAYTGQNVRVTGSQERAPGDFIVSASVVDPGDAKGPATPISFRVLDEGAGKYALVDASVEGVWFTLAQRDEFAGFLSQNGGDVAKLAAHLHDMQTQPHSGVAAP